MTRVFLQSRSLLYCIESTILYIFLKKNQPKFRSANFIFGLEIIHKTVTFCLLKLVTVIVKTVNFNYLLSSKIKDMYADDNNYLSPRRP